MKIREALAALDRTKHIHNMMERVFPDIPSCYISDDYYNETRFGICTEGKKRYAQLSEHLRTAESFYFGS